MSTEPLCLIPVLGFCALPASAQKRVKTVRDITARAICPESTKVFIKRRLLRDTPPIQQKRFFVRWRLLCGNSILKAQSSALFVLSKPVFTTQHWLTQCGISVIWATTSCNLKRKSSPDNSAAHRNWHDGHNIPRSLRKSSTMRPNVHIDLDAPGSASHACMLDFHTADRHNWCRAQEIQRSPATSLPSSYCLLVNTALLFMDKAHIVEDGKRKAASVDRLLWLPFVKPFWHGSVPYRNMDESYNSKRIFLSREPQNDSLAQKSSYILVHLDGKLNILKRLLLQNVSYVLKD